MASTAETIAARLVAAGRVSAGLARTAQVSRSTVLVEGAAVAVPDALASGVGAASDVVVVSESQVSTADAVASSAADAARVAVEADRLALYQVEADRFQESFETNSQITSDNLRSAQDTADSAMANAALAQVTADGKNAIFKALATSAPSANAAGDLWYVVDSAGKVTGIRIASAAGTGSWVAYQIVADSLLVPSSVGTALIGDGVVTAPKLVASEELWAKVLGAHLITGDELQAESIYSRHVAIGDFTNLASGSDFEDTTKNPWSLISGVFGISPSQSHSGTRSLSINGSANGTSSLAGGGIPVQAGDQFYVEFWMRRSADWNGTSANSKMRFGFNGGGLGSVSMAAAEAAATTWTKRTGLITVPDNGTTLMTVTIVNTDATAGYLWVDDVIIRRCVAGELIVDGAIDGKTVTGAIVRTAASGLRVQLDTVGLRTFNASGTETGRLAASTGGLTLTGKIVTGTSGQRIELTSTDIQWFAPRGVAGNITAENDGGTSARLVLTAGTKWVKVGSTDLSEGGTADLYANVIGADTVSAAGVMSNNYANKSGGISAPYAMASGVVTPTSAAVGGIGSTTVTFPSGRFTVAPSVQVTSRSSQPQNRMCSTGSIGTASFVLYQYNGTTSAGSASVDWNATQMLPNAAAG